MKPFVSAFGSLAICALVNLLASSQVFAQGALTPPGAPAPTMKTLNQIEPRIPITNSINGLTLTQPGSYYLTTNIVVSSGDAITIGANNITLDLNGFILTSTAPTANGAAITFAGSKTNVNIFNGFISSAVTNNGLNSYGGPGWTRAIYASNPVYNARVSDLTVHGCALQGIYFAAGSRTLVRRCVVNNTGWEGITADLVTESLSNVGGYNAAPAIQADLAINCRGVSYAGPGISAAFVAGNCSGFSTNSYGVSTLVAGACRGGSVSQIGVFASLVDNCYGSSGTSRGISTIVGRNSYGLGASSANYGFYTSGLAMGCYGGNFLASGISGFILNSCGGTDVSASYKFNMP